MNKLQTLCFTVIGFCLMTSQASASAQNVPEIDGGGALLATALVAGVVGIIREVKSKK